MTHTLISLISIAVGIIGANLTGLTFKKYSFGLIGNTISGVFGSAFVTKSLGRLGFAPNFIIERGTVNYSLLALNVVVSFLAAALALILISKLKNKMNQSKQ